MCPTYDKVFKIFLASQTIAEMLDIWTENALYFWHSHNKNNPFIAKSDLMYYC